MSAGLLEALGQRLSTVELPPPGVCGVLTRVTGMLLGARGVRAPLGAYCEVMAEQGEGGLTEMVRWVELTTNHLLLHASPLSVAEIFRRQVDARPRAWILTSATLAVGGDFSLYQQQMGLQQSDAVCWDSPFDYGTQALLCVPRGLPEPNQPCWSPPPIRRRSLMYSSL